MTCGNTRCRSTTASTSTFSASCLAQFRLDVTEFLMFEHNAQDGSMWGGYGSSTGPVGYNGTGYPFERNVNL